MIRLHYGDLIKMFRKIIMTSVACNKQQWQQQVLLLIVVFIVHANINNEAYIVTVERRKYQIMSSILVYCVCLAHIKETTRVRPWS